MPTPPIALQLAGDGLAVPEDGPITALRALLSARRSAVRARTAAINQIHALLVTAPSELRERYCRHSTTVLVKTLARCPPSPRPFARHVNSADARQAP
jgi:hypothetical protein